MRQFILAAVAVLLCTSAWAVADDTGRHRDISNKIEEFAAAWNRHDSDAMASKWEKDGDLIDPFGHEARGRIEISRLFSDKFRGPLRDSHLEMSIESIKMIHNQIAVVDGTARITGPREPDGHDVLLHEHHVTLVMHEDWGWHFSSVRAFFFQDHPASVGPRVLERTYPGTDISRKALFVRLEAKPGREKDVEEFLVSGLHLAMDEPATTAWFGIRLSPSSYAIFDVFPDEAGRQAHLTGKVAAALMERAPDLFAQPPTIEKVDVVAAKLP